jgi:hypothetical protein
MTAAVIGTINRHLNSMLRATVTDSTTQPTPKKASLPTERRFSWVIAFLVPAELPFWQSKNLTYREKIELKWLLRPF